MDRIYFTNNYEDYNPNNCDIIDGEKLNEYCIIYTKAEELWSNYIKKLKHFDTNDTSIYTGTAGIALLKLKFEKGTDTGLKEILNLLGLKRLKRKRFSFLCGDAGPLAIAAVVYHKLGCFDQSTAAIQSLLSLRETINDADPEVANEYLYGRIGYLYALLYINKNVPSAPISSTVIRDTIEQVLKWGRHESSAGSHRSPLMYKWHDSFYLGAAHGLTGTLYLLLKAKAYLQESELSRLVKPSIDCLQELRFKSGNYPSSLGSGKDKLVQWCHGAPGFLFLYCEAYRVFGDVKYLQWALECGDVIWERGLLRKGYSLCHGVAGNAYCFLELYKTTKVAKHLYRAARFAEWCVNYTTAHEDHPPDRPLSLFEGKAGPLYLILDMKDPLNAKFPGFQL